MSETETITYFEKFKLKSTIIIHLIYFSFFLKSGIKEKKNV